MKLGTVQLVATVVTLILAPLFFGSVELFWIIVWTVVLSIAALCGLATPLGSAQNRLLLCFFALCSVYLLAATAQVVPHFVDQLNDPGWQHANDLLGIDASSRISNRGEIPPIAAGHFLLFTLSFLNGFYLGKSRRKSEILLRIARYAILAYVAYALTAFVFTPDLLLWAPKLAYVGSLTATFVNRNTAATFLGAGAILWSCHAVSAVQSFGFLSVRQMLLTHSNESVALKIIGRSAATLMCFLAVILTGSRGGLICCCAGLLFATVLMVASRKKASVWGTGIFASAAFSVLVVTVGQSGRIGSGGLFDEGRWSVYVFCMKAVLQRPYLGTGIGTFADIFPALRGDDFYSLGVWEYAHSTILEIAVEMGIPVAAVVAIAGVASVSILVRGALRSDRRSRRALAGIGGVAVLTYLHSMIDFSLQIPGYFTVFGILLGCGLGMAYSSNVALGADRLLVGDMRPSVDLR